MAELFIGAMAATGLIVLVWYAQTRGISVSWWQWLLTVLAFAYGVFVLEVVVAFLREGTPQGAAVIGTLMGFVGVLWGVLLSRWVFAKGTGGGRSEEVAHG